MGSVIKLPDINIKMTPNDTILAFIFQKNNPRGMSPVPVCFNY